jgi:hypothetical protein
MGKARSLPYSGAPERQLGYSLPCSKALGKAGKAPRGQMLKLMKNIGK